MNRVIDNIPSEETQREILFIVIVLGVFILIIISALVYFFIKIRKWATKKGLEHHEIIKKKFK